MDYNLWNNFYQNIRDSSWPDCPNEHEFFNLPIRIQDEIIDLHNGLNLIKLQDKDITYLPMQLADPCTINNEFDLTFSVASNFQVYYNNQIPARGHKFGQNYPRVIKYLYPNRKFHHCLDWAAGAGFIGFRLLADGVCKNLSLMECYEPAVLACNKTISHMPEEFKDNVQVILSDSLNSCKLNNKFDLIVANTPAHSTILWPTGDFKNLSITDWSRISTDRNWEIHRDFFLGAKKALNEDGVILLQEKTYTSSVFEFQDMIHAAGLKIISAFTENVDGQTWYLHCTHK